MSGLQLPVTTETLLTAPGATVSRFGRYIVAALHGPHQVLSTSAHCGGQRADLQFLANHQSCEARGDSARTAAMSELGLENYHFQVCAEMNVDPDKTAVMGTAANMAYVSHRSACYERLRCDAFITAGVSGNAAKAGDPAEWLETEDGWREVSQRAGTINIILLISHPITPAALARAAVTMTEGKAAALTELAVPSRYSSGIATGTGTDQFCIAAPIDEQLQPLESTSPHTKAGEIIGRSVRQAVKEALRWQNGLEPSYTRSVFHALGRFGLTEERARSDLPNLLPPDRFDLLRKNWKAVFFEPGVAAAAFGLAAVLDRAAFGTLPESSAKAAARQQAACLACSLSARPEAWLDLYSELDCASKDPANLVLRAVAAGWLAKWT